MFVKRFCPPYLVFTGAPVDGGGSSAEGQNPPEDTDLGFPAGTPVDQMTPEQKAAYWRHEAKKQQKRAEAYSKLGDPEALASKLKDAEDAAEKARLEGLSEHEKQIEQARAEGRAEAEGESGTKFLSVAVSSAVIAITKGANESYEDASKRVSDALAFVDVSKFLGENGDLDADKVQTFAKSLGSGAGEGENDPSRFVASHVASGFKQQPGGGAGSVNALMEQIKQRKGLNN